MALQVETRATGKRLSKFRRIANAVPHVLTERDKAIIGAVAKYRLLSRSQIQRLFGFSTITRVNFRLQKLFHHGYLARHYLPTVKGSSQAIYSLDRSGVPIANEWVGTDQVNLWRPERGSHPFFLAHQLAVNDVRIEFKLAARANENHQLLTWFSENQARDRFFFGDRWHTLTPDAFLRYRVGKQVLAAFVEVDQGTMPNPRFKEKVERYFAYDISGRFTERYKGQRFRVLVIATSPKRLANLMRTTAQIAQRYFWFTTLSAIKQQGPLTSIWETIAKEAKIPLIEPGQDQVER